MGPLVLQLADQEDASKREPCSYIRPIRARLGRWLAQGMGWTVGSTPICLIVALAAVSVILQLTGEALASCRKETRMSCDCNSIPKKTRRSLSEILKFGAAVGSSMTASGLAVPALSQPVDLCQQAISVNEISQRGLN